MTFGDFHCGEIWWADFGIPFGSETGYRRPVVILQCDKMNESGINTLIVAPLTTNLDREIFAGNTFLSAEDSGLFNDSIVLGTQIGTLDKRRLSDKAGRVNDFMLSEIISSINSILGK